MIKPNFDKYRPCAGIALFNKEGKVFLGRRRHASGPYIWQMPQGGIDEGEKPKAAAVRELEEETGIGESHIQYLGKIKGWQFYDFPSGFRGTKAAYGWHGQRQKWYAYLYTGQDKHVNLNAHKKIEFTDWRWESLSKSVDLIVPFKRPVYRTIRAEFKKFARAHD